MALRLFHPERLVRMFLRREAELSSRIENTFARVQTLLLFGQIPAIERETPDVREVDNNFRALEFGLASVPHRPLSGGLIREMHEILLRGVRGHDRTPGTFRRVQAHIGRSNRIEEARFVPAPPNAIESCMRDLERYLAERGSLPALVRVAMIHYQFEAIHPFADGNGRIGRVLILLMLCGEGVLAAPLLNPSAHLERQRRAYYDHLLDVSQRGEWGAWITFFLRGVADEAVDAARRVERLETLRETYYQRVRTARASALLPTLIDHLFTEPSVTLPSVCAFLAIGQRSGQNLIDRLVGAGILRETTGQRRNRVYLAQEVVDVFATEEQERAEAAP